MQKLWTVTEASRANQKVASALAKGTLTKQPCEVCGTTANVDAHHDDYDKPLDVMWLCRKHHRLEHKKSGRRYAKDSNFGALNVRNFPPDLLQELKVEAVKKRITMRELVLGLLADWVDGKITLGESPHGQA